MDVTEIFGIEKIKREASFEEIEPYNVKKRLPRIKEKTKPSIKKGVEVVFKPKLPNPKVFNCN